MVSKDKIRHPLFGWIEVGNGFLISEMDKYTTADSLIRYVELYGYKVNSGWDIDTIKHSVVEQYKYGSISYG